MDIREVLERQLQDALDVASLALVEYLKRPMITSARGGPRLSPMFRAWNEATQNVIRLARALKAEPKSPPTLEAELEALMRKEKP